MSKVKLRLPFPERVTFISNTVISKMRPEHEADFFYKEASAYDFNNRTAISSATLKAMAAYKHTQKHAINSTRWLENAQELHTYYTPEITTIDNVPFVGSFLKVLDHKAEVVLEDNHMLAKLSVSNFTDAVRLGGIDSTGKFGCKFLFCNQPGCSQLQLVPVGSDHYLRLLKEQDVLLKVEADKKYLPNSMFTGGNVYTNEITKKSVLCLGWLEGKVLYEPVLETQFPDKTLSSLLTAKQRYCSNALLINGSSYINFWFVKTPYKAAPKVTKLQFGVGAPTPEKTLAWRTTLTDFVVAWRKTQNRRVPPPNELTTIQRICLTRKESLMT